MSDAKGQGQNSQQSPKRKRRERRPQGTPRTREPTTGSWKPGQSGNPGGRPRTVKQVQDLASTFTEEAVRALVDTMRKTQDAMHWDPKETRQAAIAIINRACGMPSQPVTGSNGRPIEDEFPDLLGALRKLAGEGG